ncbi:hypothetical protein DSM106972_039100 [Dulcicalothrix desertica PCC 7102]|uniref:Serine protease n=1 Tax=Dulcicalothrix desertica PCC 7102 TaxID=232991 RepID=A0A433VG80_9CYAN|nr:trypsin-like peptidase domain-containing protein [Dulcicalothrix desertica]RUT05089.1 hypothetical protein DSM106972_039100 [Dulcicalothrix desertica PCC 7102]TWH43402.1 protease YdgD [Dulcicalothrix desertica PCC 7102]
MNTKLFSKKSFALLFAGIFTAASVHTFVNTSVQAQNNPKPPEFTKFQDASQLKLPGNGKPFIPNGLGSSEKANGERGIPDGVDDRIPMTSNQYPWSTIGKVQGTTADAKSYHCTGTLIYDNLVLTNSHCVLDPETGVLSKKIEFMPNFINGRVSNPRDIASVQRVIYGTDFKNGFQDNSKDWAILVLDKPLGRKYGYLGWKSLPTSTLTRNPKKFFFVGYSKDFPKSNPGMTAGFEAGCSITSEEANLLLHDCDTAGGSSGGAIIATIDDQYYIVAINNMEFKNRRTGQDIINSAVKIDFLDRLFSQN